jgi:uncharacterized membrane protein (UPF0127 family)
MYPNNPTLLICTALIYTASRVKNRLTPTLFHAGRGIIYGKWLMLWAVLALSAGCNESDLVEIRVDNISLWVEIADTDQRRRTGLMHRQELGRDEGMLMIFPTPRVQQIWMLNTPIPLDVGFFDANGVLLNTVSMSPDGGRTIHESTGPALYALEMNIGWFGKNGIAPGARLSLPYGIEGR